MLIYKQPRQFNTVSRYTTYNQIVDTDLNVTYLEFPNKLTISDRNSTYHVVESSEENRLDIIAKKYYGESSLYWLIAMANNLINPMIVSQGTILKIPPYESLFISKGLLTVS